MAPDVMVLHVSANANWNKKNARNATPVEPYVCGAPCRKKYWCPIQPLPEPNMNAKPNAQNSNAAQARVDDALEIMTFDTSRVRAKPASRNMNPACMKNTRNAVTSTHIVLIGLTSRRPSVTVGVVWPSMVAPALVLRYHVIAHIPINTRPRPIIFPLKYAANAFWRSRSLIRTRKVVIMEWDGTRALLQLHSLCMTGIGHLRVGSATGT